MTWREKLSDPAHPVWPIVRILAMALFVKLAASHFDAREALAIACYGGVEGLNRLVSGVMGRGKSDG